MISDDDQPGFYGRGEIDNSGTTRLVNSVVARNGDWEYGGGIENGDKRVVSTSTVSSNSISFRGGASSGGGIHSRGDRKLVGSTFTDNEARCQTGGLLVSSGTVQLQRSLVSGNRTWDLPQFPIPGAEINSQPMYRPLGGLVVGDDYNLIGQNVDAGTVGFTPGATDVVPGVGVDAIVLALADNGGGTLTHALTALSPALDASPNDACCPATDQRGNPRPVGPACDVGAFEGTAVLCNGLVTTMVGTPQNDVLVGTEGPDVIAGFSGNDRISGLEGDDVICGNGGADRLWGGPGNNVLLGEAGNDLLFGNPHDDTLDGGDDVDECNGGAGTGDTAVDCEVISRVP